MILEGLTVAGISAPFATLVHELGHAAVGLRCTEGLVRVQVGREPSFLRLRLGRLDVRVGRWPMTDRLGGTATTFARLSRRASMAYAVAGVAAELALAFVLLGAAVGGWIPAVLAWAGYWAALSAATNLLPRSVGGVSSDGLRLLEAVAAADAPPDPFEDVRARWIVRTQDARDVARDGRGENLSIVLHGLGLAVPSAAATEAARLSVLGWCWRDAERVSTAPVVQRLSRAGTVALERGAAAQHLAGATAWEFLVGGGDPGTASAGGAAWLDRALTIVRPKQSHLDDHQASFAFRFGVAVHDAERLVV